MTRPGWGRTVGGVGLTLALLAGGCSLGTKSEREWDVVTRGMAVGGHTTFTVGGGYFPFRGRIEFKEGPLTIVAERDLSCP